MSLTQLAEALDLTFQPIGKNEQASQPGLLLRKHDCLGYHRAIELDHFRVGLLFFRSGAPGRHDDGGTYDSFAADA